MADKPDRVLFLLDAEGRYRLSFDAWQWLIHAKWPNGKWDVCAWGLRSRGEVFACLRHKDILITAEALHRIDTELMDTFVDWQEARAGIRPFDPSHNAPSRRASESSVAISAQEVPTYPPGAHGHPAAPLDSGPVDDGLDLDGLDHEVAA